MMQSVAKLADLKKRLNRFFTDRAYGRGEVHDFLAKLNPIGEVAIFGGMIRDIALVGIEGFNSDIDLVIDTNTPLSENEDFLCVIDNLSFAHKVEKNKFGGYRISLEKWRLDIWRAQDTWAIKQGLVQYSGIESLCETTFFNWDAIIYSLDRNIIFLADNYIDVINQRTLDINLQTSPNDLANVIKSLRYHEKYDATFSPNLIHYINDIIQNFSIQELYEKDLQSHSQRVFTESEISKICKALTLHLAHHPTSPMTIESKQIKLWPEELTH